MRLELRGAERRAGDDPVAESGREALDLRLDPLGHVARPAVRDVAVRPRRLLALGHATRVEEALLREENVRLLADGAAPRLALGRGDLLERAAEVDGRGARALLRRPRDRPVERPVDLEHARPVAKLLEPVAVALGQLLARHRDELARRHVEENRFRIPELGERLDARAGLDLAAERAEVRGERVGELL